MNISSSKLKRRIFFLLLSGLFSLVAFSACSSINLQNQLANQGIVRLDEYDPYFASNHYLADLLRRDQVALDFLKSQGTPDAISVRKSFLQPAKVHLFFLEKQQAFLIEHELEDIVIRGPAALPDSILGQLSQLKPLEKEAALILHPKHQNDQVEVRRANYEAGKPQETALPTAPISNVVSEDSATETYVHSVGPSRSPFIPSVPVSKTKLPNQKSSPKPFVHKVGKNNESMWSIAKWYTGKGINHKKIASFNKIKNPSRLRLGQEINIPEQIVKNRKPYPSN